MLARARLLLPLLVTIALVVWSCQRAQPPSPDPSVPEFARVQQGSGSLGQVALSVPDTIGTSIASWTASPLVTITSAGLSAISAGDQIAVWCSQTGTEMTAPTADGFVGSAYVTATKVTWNMAPITWSACPYFAATRSAGTSRGLTIYLSGSEDNGSASDAGSVVSFASASRHDFASAPDGGVALVASGDGILASGFGYNASDAGSIVYCLYNGDPSDGGSPMIATVAMPTQGSSLPGISVYGVPYDAGLYLEVPCSPPAFFSIVTVP